MTEPGLMPPGMRDQTTPETRIVDGTPTRPRRRVMCQDELRLRLDANPECLEHACRECKEGGIVPPHSVLAPGTALGSRARVALSSAQVNVHGNRKKCRDGTLKK